MKMTHVQIHKLKTYSEIAPLYAARDMALQQYAEAQKNVTASHSWKDEPPSPEMLAFRKAAGTAMACDKLIHAAGLPNAIGDIAPGDRIGMACVKKMRKGRVELDNGTALHASEVYSLTRDGINFTRPPFTFYFTPQQP